jgi:hypothetical protein
VSDDTDVSEADTTCDVYRDGTVHILSERCDTCIFRPGDPIALGPDWLRDFIASIPPDGFVTCHDTLAQMRIFKGDRYDGNAVCRGFYDSSRRSVLLDAAVHAGLVTWVRPQG